jgi:hypothetical protein
VNAASLAFSAFDPTAAVVQRRRLRKRSRDAVEWIGEQIVFFGIILDDRVTDPLDLCTDRSLEIYSRREMRIVRHHVELRVAIISDGRKVAFGRCSLAFRAARNKEYRNIQSASPLKDLKRWCDRRVTPELVPRSPTARRVNRQITRTRNGATKIVAFQISQLESAVSSMSRTRAGRFTDAARLSIQLAAWVATASRSR